MCHVVCELNASIGAQPLQQNGIWKSEHGPLEEQRMSYPTVEPHTQNFYWWRSSVQRPLVSIMMWTTTIASKWRARDYSAPSLFPFIEFRFFLSLIWFHFQPLVRFFDAPRFLTTHFNVADYFVYLLIDLAFINLRNLFSYDLLAAIGQKCDLISFITYFVCSPLLLLFALCTLFVPNVYRPIDIQSSNVHSKMVIQNSFPKSARHVGCLSPRFKSIIQHGAIYLNMFAARITIHTRARYRAGPSHLSCVSAEN